MAEKILSESRSWKGWRFSKWFAGNWYTIKELLKVGVPALVGWAATANPIWTVVITIVGKLIIDSGEYYFSTIKA